MLLFWFQYTGQAGQAILVDMLYRFDISYIFYCLKVGAGTLISKKYRKKERGFFLEAGAAYGVQLSNTLLFERKRKVSY